MQLETKLPQDSEHHQVIRQDIADDPFHSSLTRIRDRYGIAIFRRFFEAIIERCQEDGLIWGKELYADATLVEANADRDNMLPRFAVEAHLQQLFGASYHPPTSAAAHGLPSDTPTPAAADGAETAHPPVLRIGTDLSPERQAKLLDHHQKQYDWYAHNGEPDRSIKRGDEQRTLTSWSA